MVEIDDREIFPDRNREIRERAKEAGVRLNRLAVELGRSPCAFKTALVTEEFKPAKKRMILRTIDRMVKEGKVGQTEAHKLVKKYAHMKGVTLTQVSEYFGLSLQKFNDELYKPFTPERKAQILKVIDLLAEENESMGYHAYQQAPKDIPDNWPGYVNGKRWKGNGLGPF